MMPEVEVLNRESRPVGKIELPQEIFGAPVRKDIIHEAVRNYLANRRQGTAATKTRGLVRGGGRKPWRQKHTGRARAGSIRSPLWRGGGVVFGPMPRDYSYRLPRKMKWAAINSALSAKLADGEIVVVDDISITKPKTKQMVSLLEGLGLKKSVLIVIPERDRTLELAARNIPTVDVTMVNELNIYTILTHEKLLFTQKAVEKMKEVCLG